MRTLFITNVLPWPLDSGDRIRAFHMLRAVASVTEVTLCSFVYSGDELRHVEALQPFVADAVTISRDTCRYRRYANLPGPLRLVMNLLPYCDPLRPVGLYTWTSPAADALLEKLYARSFEFVWGQWLGAVPFLTRFIGSHRILNLNDVEYRRLLHRLRHVPIYRQAPLDCLDFLKLRYFERRLARRPWQFVVCSETDKQALRGNSNVRVVPNGVDLPSDAAPIQPDGAGPTLAFVGELSYEPNVDAVRFFAAEVLPLILRRLPNAQFLVVGRNPVPVVKDLHNGTTISVAASVASVGPYLKRAHAVVVPIRFGGGTRIKILEAMAHNRPVVSTTVGAEGLDVQPGRHLLVADAPSSFADACVDIITNPAMHARLTSAGFALVRDNYQWDGSVEKVRELYRALGAARPADQTACASSLPWPTT